MSNTYWNNNGKYQKAVNALQDLVPAEGKVLKAKQNPNLEHFREACNCYYDLYNNGLCNRASEFRKVFGIRSSAYGSYRRGFVLALYDLVEQEMDDIIEAAANEQEIAL